MTLTHDLSTVDRKPLKFDLREGFVFILTAAVAVSGYSNNAILSAAILAGFILAGFTKPEYLIGPMIFTSMFDDYLVAFQNQSFSRFLTLMLLVFTLIRVLVFNKMKIVQKRASAFIALLIAAGVILSLRGAYDYVSFPITFVLNLSLALVIANYSTARKNIVIRQLYVYSVISIVFLIYLLSVNGLSTILTARRITIVENTNANQTAMSIAAAAAILLGYILYKKKAGFLNVLLLITAVAGVFLTGSRSALVGVAAAIFLLLLIGSSNMSFKKGLFWILAAAAALVLIVFLLNTYLPNLMKRFTLENVSDTGGTNRLVIWDAFFKGYFKKNFFFGMGFDSRNFSTAMFYSINDARGAHNIVVETLASMGVLGLAAFVVFFGVTISDFMKKRGILRELLIPLGVIFAMIANGIGENTLTNRFMWLAIGLGYMFINGERSENEEQK